MDNQEQFFSDCPVTKENKNFLIISDKQTDPSTGIRKCSSLAGKLYDITSQTVSEEIKKFLKKNLISKGENILVANLLFTRHCESNCIKKYKILNKKFHSKMIEIYYLLLFALFSI